MSKIAEVRTGSRTRRRLVGFCLFLAPVLGLFSIPGSAQPVDTAVFLQQLQQQTSQGGFGGSSNSQAPASPDAGTVQPATLSSQRPLPSSRLEQILSGRAGAKLQQFGYDQLGQGRAVAVPQTGAVQDDYILGRGDELLVSARGQENAELRAIVDSNGQVVLPRLNPIPAAGRRFADFRADVQTAVRRSFVATTAFVSVSKVRQVTVQVSGEVNVPGQRILPGLTSAVDALVLSGGVKKTGSLRSVRVQRGSRTFNIDLYSVLTNQGAASNFQLTDGDRILVPPLGKTVAVSGLVRQPGIFELPPGASSITARNLLSLAGGFEVRGNYRLSALRVAANGASQMTALANDGASIGDSEILFVQLGASQSVNAATLSGGAALAGQYPITPATKLSDFLKSPGALPPAPYTLFGLIARKDPRTLLRTLLPFTPVAVLNGSEDQALQSEDIIRVFSVNEARLLTNTVRLYVQRQASEQAAIRNPLGQDAPPLGNDASASATGNLAEFQRGVIADLAEQVDPVTQQAQRNPNTAATNPNAAPNQAFTPPFPGQAFPGQAFPGQAFPGQAFPGQDQAAAEKFAIQNGTFAPNGSVGGTGTNSTGFVPQRPPALNFEEADASLGQVATNRDIGNFGDLARQLGIDQLVLVNFLMDHQATLNGAVGGPGSFFIGPSVPLQDLVQAAGGTTNWADESGVELISTAVDTQTGRSSTRRTQLPLRQGMLASYVVHPGDQFRFNQVFTDSGLGTATVQGEVRFTGSYQITRGEHLSDLLARAGGLTNTAYPYGTVFLRKSAAATEHEGYIRAAKEIEEGLVVAMTRIGNDKIDPGTFGSLQVFVNELRNQKAVGRIAIAADPSVLATRPELDPLLEPGDVVYIPQRPSTITVLGQVMLPGSLPYRSGNTLSDYIQQSGGYGSSADASNTFIVFPDGSARKIQSSWLSFDTVNLPPGSAVVVPRDVTPLNTRQLIMDVTGIFSQLAVTVASLAVISR